MSEDSFRVTVNGTEYEVYISGVEQHDGVFTVYANQGQLVITDQVGGPNRLSELRSSPEYIEADSEKQRAELEIEFVWDAVAAAVEDHKRISQETHQTGPGDV